jgi:hypothetical protein
MLEGFGDVRMAAVAIGGIEEAEAVLVAIQKKLGEALDAESSLMRMMAGADGARAHGEATGLDTGLPQSDVVRRAKLARKGLEA